MNTKAPETSLTQDVVALVRHRLSGRRGLLLAVVALAAAGAAWNWHWLVVAGVAPVILGLLPCVAMCAVGLCMHKMGGKDCAAEQPGTTDTRPSAEIEASATTPETHVGVERRDAQAVRHPRVAEGQRPNTRGHD